MSFAGHAGLPDGLDVLTRSKGREVVLANNVNNVDLLDDLVWNAVKARLTRLSVFAASMWSPSDVSFGDRRLRGVYVPEVHGVAGLTPELKAKVRTCTLTADRTAAGMKAQEDAGRHWLLVTSARRADQPSLLDIPEVAAASVYEVSHRLPGGNEQAPSLNTFLTSALVSIVHAQQNGAPATSLGNAWVRTGSWQNAKLSTRMSFAQRGDSK